MQAISVYLYPNKIDVYTNSLATWTTERYRRVYNRNVKIYRGIDNRVDLQVRNADERATDATGASFVFNLIEPEGQNIILKKDCQVVDASRGRFYVILTEDELVDIEAGSYKYSVFNEVRTTNFDGTYTVTSRNPTYADSQYGITSTLEVLGNPLGDIKETVVVTEFAKVMDMSTYTINHQVSSIIDARPTTSVPQSVHTFQIMSTGYAGKIRIQGSLSSSSDPAEALWVDIPDSAISPGVNNFNPEYAPTVYKNVTGKWNWFRIIHSANNSGTASFTIEQTILGNYICSVYQGGKNYSINETVTILGSTLGGVDGVNDLVVTVTAIDVIGAITGITYTGTSIVGYKTFVTKGTGPKVVGTVDKVLYR